MSVTSENRGLTALGRTQTCAYYNGAMNCVRQPVQVLTVVRVAMVSRPAPKLPVFAQWGPGRVVRLSKCA